MHSCPQPIPWQQDILLWILPASLGWPDSESTSPFWPYWHFCGVGAPRIKEPQRSKHPLKGVQKGASGPRVLARYRT